MRDDVDLVTLRRQVEVDVRREQRHQQRGLFFANLGMFIALSLVAWVMIPSIDQTGIPENMVPAMLILTIGWVVALVMQAISAFGTTSEAWLRDTRKRLLVSAIEDAQLGLDDEPVAAGQFEKAKRGLNIHLVLSDEGELLDIVDEDESILKRGTGHEG